MTHANSLQLAFRFCQGIRIVVVLLFGGFVSLLLYSFLNPDAFQTVLISDAFRAGFGIGHLRICTDCAGTGQWYLSELGPGMKSWLLLRGSIFFVLTLLIIRLFLRIIQSIQSASTFYAGNIQTFRQLARYGLVIAGISMFNFFIQGEISDLHFSIPFTPLAFALGCWVLADIFEEGKVLMEDKHSII